MLKKKREKKEVMDISTDVKFMPHQQEAINKLNSGNILCGGVGTGKSITALGYFYVVECGAMKMPDGSYGPMKHYVRLYIITTARKRDTKEWEAECAHFDFAGTEIVIDSWNNLHKYENVEGAFFIFDEQRVIGSGSWSKSFVRLSRKNHWILLTATPGDTWMDYIPVFIANGFYKSKRRFLERHAVYSRYSKYPKVDKWLEAGYLEQLRRSITVVMNYEKHTERHWEDVVVDYDIQLYSQVADKSWNPWKNEPIRDIATACYLMRKAVNSDPRRMDAVRSKLMVSEKAIIFYNYDYELEMLRELKGYCPIAEWNGHVHEPLPEGERWAYLVQYAAGCEGWNCVTANTIIFFSQNYSYKAMEQAAGRIDRINTPYSHLYYYVLRTKAPIDMAIRRAIKCKRNFNEKLFLGNYIFNQEQARTEQVSM